VVDESRDRGNEEIQTQVETVTLKLQNDDGVQNCSVLLVFLVGSFKICQAAGSCLNVLISGRSAVSAPALLLRPLLCVIVVSEELSALDMFDG